MQPVLKTRANGRTITTFALRATTRSNATTAPTSRSGGNAHVGNSGKSDRGGTSPAGGASKNITEQYCDAPSSRF